MPKILFVCWGNGNRSPMAEGYYNYLTHSNNASSAGLSPEAAHLNPHPNPNTVTVMREEGIDISKHQGQTLTKEMLDKSDKVIVLCEKESCPKYLLESGKVKFWEIEDPWRSKNLDGFRKSRDLIKAKITQLVDDSFKWN